MVSQFVRPTNDNLTACCVDGCQLGAAAAATGHNCQKCKAAVHLYCVERVLGLKRNDPDDDVPILCSLCFSKEKNKV